DCSNSAADRSSSATITSGSKATAAGAADAHAEAEQLLFREQGQFVIDQAQQLMTAVAATAARPAAYADTQLSQIPIGQHVKLGFDSSDQVGFDRTMQNAFMIENPNLGDCGESSSCITAAGTTDAHAEPEQLLVRQQAQSGIDQA